jgi:hypothetical protein
MTKYYKTRKGIVNIAEKWLSDGYGVAIYMNVDMSSPEIGHKKLLRVGKDSTFKEAPKRLPDTKTEINWIYGLVEVVKNKKRLKEVL